MKLLSRGSAAIHVVVGAAVLVLVILPLFSAIIERYILTNKIEIIRDAADITNIAVYNTINTAMLGKKSVSFDQAKVDALYKQLLAENLNLNSALEPIDGESSIADGTVTIDEVNFYTGPLPAVCPGGCTIGKPAVHSCITVPVKPSLYRQVILGLSGKSYIALKVHVDSEIPLNN